MDTAKTLKLNGRSVNYVDQGQGEPLLLVHGFPLDHTMWQQQIDFFQTNYRVISPDLPGFGASESISDSSKPNDQVTEPTSGSSKPISESSKPTSGSSQPTSGSTEPISELASNTETLSMGILADWLVDFLDAIDCKQPINYCGLSMGGYIGWQFWRRHATRLKSMIAANTRAAKDDELVRRARHMAAAQVRVSGALPVADAMIKKLFHQPSDQNPLDIDYIAAVHQTILSTHPFTISAGQIGMSQRIDATPWLSEMTIPMLFISGDHDQITPPPEMQTNATTVGSNAQFTTIPAAGHLTPLEQPAVFNTRVNQFLANLP